MNKEDLEEFILRLPGVWLEYPFGDGLATYKVNRDGEDPEPKMMALIDENAKPLRISLKCDPLLARTLREMYDEVQPGINLNKKQWNTIVCTGQVSEEDLKGLIRLSYQLVTE
ncbi:MAG: MmcQ/YjbR family DNA-binding protein [Candidatus Saccharimonas sp.]